MEEFAVPCFVTFYGTASVLQKNDLEYEEHVFTVSSVIDEDPYFARRNLHSSEGPFRWKTMLRDPEARYPVEGSDPDLARLFEKRKKHIPLASLMDMERDIIIDII